MKPITSVRGATCPTRPVGCPKRPYWRHWVVETRWLSPTYGKATTFSTLVPAAASMCFFPPARVGASGFAYGLDMTDEMLTLARANAAKAGAVNVEFIKGQIEDIPLPAGSVDVIISNCVINLSTDKRAVISEMFRVLKPGGRLGISDVVAEDQLSPAERAQRGSFVGCIAGALSRTEYTDSLSAAGFVDPEVVFTHQAVPGMHGAIVRAVKPAAALIAES